MVYDPKQGQVSLVLEALQRKSLLKKYAFSKTITFYFTRFLWWERYFYTIGLKLYDLLARRLALVKVLCLINKRSVQQCQL